MPVLGIHIKILDSSLVVLERCINTGSVIKCNGSSVISNSELVVALMLRLNYCMNLDNSDSEESILCQSY